MNKAFLRMRPILTLEPSAQSPMVLRGIMHAWRTLENPSAELKWYERLLPNKYRMSFIGIEGLEAFAVNGAQELDGSRRSPEWRRLLKWMERYPQLSLPRKVALLELLAQLCLYRDVEALLAGDDVSPDRTMSEARSYYFYWRAFIPFMLYEGVQRGSSEAILDVARSAPKTARIRLVAALKYLVLNLERKIAAPGMGEARRIADESLKGLESKLPPVEALCLRSKYWRTVCYFPFYQRDLPELERELDLAENMARAAVAKARRGGPFAVGYAAENLHAVLATRAITHMHLNSPQAAIPWFGKMIAMDPQGSWQRIGLGRALLLLGQFEEARIELENGFELAAAGREEACRWLARCDEELGRREQAELWTQRGEALRAASEKVRTGGKPYIADPLFR